MTSLRVACIPGDGIGQEVLPAACDVLDGIAALAEHDQVFLERSASPGGSRGPRRDGQRAVRDGGPHG